MLKNIIKLSLCLIICHVFSILHAVENYLIHHNTVCVNSDNDMTCEDRTIKDIQVSYGAPATIDVAYAENCDSNGCYTLAPVLFKLTKSLPRDISPLTFLHAVRTLSSLPEAQNGTADSPYAEYRAYSVGSARRDYSVNIALSNGETELDSFDLNTKTPQYLLSDDNFPVVARLFDEHISPVKDDTPSGMVLFVPVKPDGSHEPVYEGLLVPQAVAAEIMDARQLNQLRDADLAEVNANPNASTTYLVRYLPAFRNALTDMGSSLMLVRRVNDHSFSTVRLELSLAYIKTHQLEAVGWIKEHFVSPVEAMSGKGKINVTVQNAGALKTGYLISVNDCSFFGGAPVVSRFIELAPGTEGSFEFDLPMNSDTADLQFCYVYLHSLTGRMFDAVDLYWTPTATDTFRTIF